MFGGNLTPEARELVAFLSDNARSPRRIADFIHAYFDALASYGNPAQGSLLGEVAAPSKADLIAAARRKLDAELAAQEAIRKQPERADASNVQPARKGQQRPEDTRSSQGGDKGAVPATRKQARQPSEDRQVAEGETNAEALRSNQGQPNQARGASERGQDTGRENLQRQPQAERAEAQQLQRGGDRQEGARPQAVAGQQKALDQPASEKWKAGNFALGSITKYLPEEEIAKVKDFLSRIKQSPQKTVEISPEDRERAEALLAPLIERAKQSKPDFDQRVVDIAKRTGALGQILAPVKSMKRAVEKLVQGDFDTSSIKDLLRSTIVVERYADAQGVLDAISREFKIIRIKNRSGVDLSGEKMEVAPRQAYGGYADILVNVELPDGTVGEIQINVPSMLAAKELGHELYEIERSLPEDSDQRDEVTNVMSSLYDAAYFNEGGVLLKQMPSSGAPDLPFGSLVGRSSVASSENLYQVPSGNMTYSSPPNVGTNTQPSGNLSGTLIGSDIGSPSAIRIAETGTSVTKEGETRLSRSPSTIAAYESRIDALWNGAASKFHGVRVLDRSDLLDLLGFGNQPVFLQESKIVKGKVEHNLTEEHWKKVPQWLEDPAMVLDSDTVPGRLVFLAPEQLNGAPIVMVVEPSADKDGKQANLLVNVYDKDSGRMPLRRWIDEGLLRYYDKRTSPAILARSGLQLSSLAQARGRGWKIFNDADLVKYRKQSSTRLSRGQYDSLIAQHNLFSRGAGRGMALRDLQAVVDRVSKGFKNLPRVHVLESPDALSTKDPSQKTLRDYIRQAGAWEDVEGATHDGEIYLFASGISDEARAEHVLATHEVTHYGLRGAVGKDLDAALQHIYLYNGKVRKAADELKRKLGLKSNVEAVEEVLADMPDSELVKLRGWRRVVQAIRDWLRRVGAVRLADRLDAWMQAGLDEQIKADLLVADLVRSAREWVRTGRAGAPVSGTILSGQTLADDLARQQKWLNSEAKARGYRDIDELAEKDYPLFEKLAELWRKKNPVKGELLSRGISDVKADMARSGTDATLELRSYTPDELRQREAELRQAQKDGIKQLEEKELRSKADAERKNFVLTESNRPADQLEARGQLSLFSRNVAHAWADAPLDEAEYIKWGDYYRNIYGKYKGNTSISSRTTPVDQHAIPPVGSWRIADIKGAYGREIEQLVEIPLDRLKLTELDAKGGLEPAKAGDDARYAQWLREGKRPPPIEVVQTDTGELTVVDGHRRALAAKLAGRKTIEAWVSYAVPAPSGIRLNGRPDGPFVRVGLTYEMLTGEVQNPYVNERIALSRSGGETPEREFAATERAYGGREAYERAKAEGRTKLNYRQWVQVRTPAFKQWFGDWELANLARTMRRVRGSDQAKAVRGEIVGKPLTNVETGIVATVSGETWSKMLSKSVVDRSVSPQAHYQALGNLDMLFRLATERLSRPGKQAVDARSIRAIHHFDVPMPFNGEVMRVKIMAKEFAAPEQGTRIYLVQAVEIENVGVVGRDPEVSGQFRRGEPAASQPPPDVSERFAQMVSAVNGDSVSKVVDPDTGEPMVVYHGSPSRPFYVFDLSRAGQTHPTAPFFGLKDQGFFGRGFYFTPDREVAEKYRRGKKGYVVDAFLNIKKPIDLSSPELPDGFREALDEVRAQNGVGPISDDRYAALVERWKTADGNRLNPQYGRGSILRELQDAFVRAGIDGAFGDGEIVAFRPEQIKSAIGNRGTFSPENPDIRLSRAADQSGQAVRSDVTRFSRSTTPTQQPAQTVAERAEAIIRQKAATPKLLDDLTRKVVQTVGIDKVTRSAYEKGAALLDKLTPEKIKAGVISDYGIPQAVIDQRAAMAGRQRRQLRKSADLIERLSMLTREVRAYPWCSRAVLPRAKREIIFLDSCAVRHRRRGRSRAACAR